MIYPKIKEILDKEINRQNDTIELIASENFASQAVKDLCGSVFTNKYAEGYSGKRYYNGCDHMDEIEDLAINEVTKLYKCQFANVQPHSGVGANSRIPSTHESGRCTYGHGSSEWWSFISRCSSNVKW